MYYSDFGMGAQESTGRRQQQVIDLKDDVPRDAKAYKLWSHIHQAVKNQSLPCTIFVKKLDSSDGSSKYYENGIKLLKQLKHPYILKFLDGASTANDVSLVTERVQMLDHSIESLSIDEIQSGLYHILEAVLFLHTKASLSHNNLTPASIFVASNGEWKLGGIVTNSCSLNSALPSVYLSICLQKSLVIVKEKDSARIQVSLNKAEEKVRSLREIAAQLTTGDPAQRIQLHVVFAHPALSNSLIQIIEFCNTIHLRTDEEKDEFFRDIVPRLRCIPGDVVARRLSRLLLSRYVLLETRCQSELYPALLVPAGDQNGILSRDHFQRHMIPEILRLFKVRESAVRIVLLSHFNGYARYIPHERLVGFVTDEVIQGCFDSDSQLVAASLRALATLVEIAGADAVCPWPISKTFANGSPMRSRASAYATSNFFSVNYVDGTKVNDGAETEKKVSAAVSGDQTGSWSDEGIADWNNDSSWSADWKGDDKSTSDHEPEPAKEIPDVVESHSSTFRVNTPPDSKKGIGSEFEISVPTQRSLEDELLADLTPKITTKSLVDQLSTLQSTINALSAAKKVPPKFAMVETVDETEGWDETMNESLTSVEDVVMVCSRANA
ncbi:unnamed protein product [Haemonchus placei]|uniref:Protein kinase domain-containing protein n=1 Tax=Haemonchus placei TaxID=6290 RepID=A0A0N4WBF4_HAEPC|nr:unnamed protein product [Haemonchus placei]